MRSTVFITLLCALAGYLPAAAHADVLVRGNAARIDSLVASPLDTVEHTGYVSIDDPSTSDLARLAAAGIAVHEDRVVHSLEAAPQDPMFYASSAYWHKAHWSWMSAGGRAGAGVTIAIIDSGVETGFADFPTQVAGIDTTDANDGPKDTNGHGTNVAAIALAASNTWGTVGIAPRATLMPVQALTGGSGTESDIAEGITWATDHGADVINLSLGASAPLPAVLSALQYARAQDVIVVCAAGNTGQMAGSFQGQVMWPARYDECLSITNVDQMQGAPLRLHATSASGTSVDYAATGTYVAGYNLQGEATFSTGTSMAAPAVSGMVALLLGSGTTPANVIAALNAGGVDAGAAGADAMFGRGYLSVESLFGLTEPQTNVTGTTTTDPQDDAAPDGGSTSDSEHACSQVIRSVSATQSMKLEDLSCRVLQGAQVTVTGGTIQSGVWQAPARSGQFTISLRWPEPLMTQQIIMNVAKSKVQWATPRVSCKRLARASRCVIHASLSMPATLKATTPASKILVQARIGGRWKTLKQINTATQTTARSLLVPARLQLRVRMVTKAGPATLAGASLWRTFTS